VVLRFVRHACNDSNTETHKNIGLDDIRIARREYDIRVEAPLREGAFKRSFVVKIKDVAHEWMTGEILER